MSNVEYQAGDLIFEWDSEKARINKRKHNVSFKTAASVLIALNCAMKNIPTTKTAGKLSAKLMIFCSSCTLIARTEPELFLREKQIKAKG